MFDRLPAPERARVDSAWAAFQDAEVTAIVREVRDSLDAVRPGLSLSAAVLADTLTARAAQPPGVDGVAARTACSTAPSRCATPPQVQTVMEQLAAHAGAGRSAAGSCPASPSTTPRRPPRRRRSREHASSGYPAVALYSYDSLFEREGLWQQLHAYLSSPRTLEDQP